MTKKNIICITPIKNEEWILEKFLRCTSLWADYIILADQNSTDRSREIASKFGKVILIENDSLELDEIHRQNLLLDEARKIEGENIIFSFDADEILSSNFHDSLEWTSIKNYKKGTVFKFKRCEIMPNFKQYWIPKNEESWGYWGFVDDGSVMDGPSIHSNRLPINFDNEIIKLEEIKLLHFQYTDWQRMESKHRWYKCFERIKFPTKKAIDICNLYNTVY